MMTTAQLKAIRKDLGVSQALLADGLGLSLRAYEEIEAGRSELRKIHENALFGFLLRFGIPGAKLPSDFIDLIYAAAGRYEKALAVEKDRRNGPEDKGRPGPQ